MTKPADQIAKARERELKAREFREHGEWMTTMPANYPVGESSRWEDRYAAAFAESERQAVIEDCAKIADQIAKSCSACSYSRKKHGEEPSFCENFGCSSFADLAAAIRCME